MVKCKRETKWQESLGYKDNDLKALKKSDMDQQLDDIKTQEELVAEGVDMTTT